MIRNNFCESRECSKSCTNSIICSNCYKKYCSYVCLSLHFKEHSKDQLKSNEKQAKKEELIKNKESNILDVDNDLENHDCHGHINESKRSIFMKEGQYLSDIINDEDYDISFVNILLTKSSIGV